MSYGPYLLQAEEPDAFQANVAWLPYEAEQILVSRPAGAQAYTCLVRPIQANETGMLLDVDIIGVEKGPILQIRGLQLRPATAPQILQAIQLPETKKSSPTATEAGQQTGAGKPADIAVVGLSCRFPGADDADAFWENLNLAVRINFQCFFPHHIYLWTTNSF